MVGIDAAQVINVKRDLRVVHEALEEFTDELRIELSDHRSRERGFKHQPGPAREINHDA